MSVPFVLAPVPPTRRRRPRASSRSSGSSTACSRNTTGTRSRSGSTSSCSHSRARSRRPSFRTVPTPRRTTSTSATNHLEVPSSASFVSFTDSPFYPDTHDDQFAAYPSHHPQHQTVSASTSAADFLRSPITPATGFAFSKLETFGYSSGFFHGAASNAATNSTSQQDSVSRSNPPRPDPVLRRFKSAFASSKSQPSTPKSDAIPPVPVLPKPAGIVKTKTVQLLRTGATTDVQSDNSARSTKSSRRKNVVRPVPYSTIVELNMFFEGGSEKDWISRSQKSSKKLRSVEPKPLPELPPISPIIASVIGAGVEVGGFKDEDGAIWWDETEKLEFASLLPKEDDESIITTTVLSDDSSWVDVDNSANDSKTGETPSTSSSDASLECLLDELQEMVTLGAVMDRKHLRSASASSVPFVVPSRPRKSKAAPAYLFPVELATQKTGSGRRRSPPPPLTLTPTSPTSTTEVVASAGPIASARHFHFGGGVHHQHSHSYSQPAPHRPQAHARSLSFEDSFMSNPPEEIAFASRVATQVALEQQRQMQDRQWQNVYAATRSLTSQKNTKKAALGAFFKGLGRTASKPGMF